MMESAGNILGGLILIAAGLHQWMPLKDACLNHCQARHYHNSLGSLSVGFRHGRRLLLGPLLFVAGIMNLVWIAGIAFFVLAKKSSLARTRK
jgi:predicted metal-binding membrane protein